jgi:hypothetical protein
MSIAPGVREPTAYALDEQGNRVGTITHEFAVGNEIWRQRWDGTWARVYFWPEDEPEQPPGRHRLKARHRR